MSYEDTPDAWLNEDDRIVKEAKRRFKACVEWEEIARVNFEYDYKFANGDSLNMYQWDSWVVGDRVQNQRPCLTINKTMQHCLQIINDGKQNKPGVNIRPVGDTASFEAAQIFEELVRHIEYISNAETIYDSASEFQVLGGIGYWRLVTEHAVNDPRNGDMFEQEIYIRRIKDPRSVYLDPDINEIDGSDARFGFIFVDKPTDLYDAEYPNFKDIGGSAIFNTTSDGWFTKNHVRVCEYFRRVDKPDNFIWFKMPESGEEVQGFKSKLPKEAVAMFKDIKRREGNLPAQERSYKERSVIRGDIEWYKIAGNTIISREPWAGSYVPIIRIIGRETVIDGKLDRAGHVRPLLDPQRIYNVNALALNTLVPTPSGWSTMGELKAGDFVFNECGEPVKVIGESPVFIGHKCYRIEFSDGIHIIADENHPWIVDEKRPHKDTNGNHFNETLKLTTKELNKSHRIWATEPLKNENANLVIHPYILGLWLGDGVNSSSIISAHADDVDEVINNINSCGYVAGIPRYPVTGARVANINIHGLTWQLKLLGLFGNKHIPDIYLRASIEQRYALLQGLMDTDGHSSIDGKCVFNNSNERLIDGTAELVRSLGIRIFIKWFEGRQQLFPNGIVSQIKPFCRIKFTANPDIPIFKLRRKFINHSKPRLTHERRTKYHVIESITEIHSVPVKCITVNGGSHLFLVSRGMIATHNSSANVEYGALQTKAPITAPVAAIEGFEEIYAKLNTTNPAVVPYNNYDEDGNKLDRPERMAPPQPSPAYVEQMKIAQNEMMMVSGQYQAQMGENENAKSGVAINQRQRQGDRATFHFVDGQMIGIRNTGRQLLDLIPKIYDTKRVMRIEAKDGTIINLTIDPDAQQALQKNMPDPNVQAHDQVVEAIFNPSVGRYTVISDSGPSFATRRQEAFNALTQIAANNKEFMNIAGDILWKVADFPEAQVLAQRWRKIIPPNISGDAPNPQMTEAMNQAAQKIEQQLALITQQQKQLDDKDRELAIKEREVTLKENVAGNESVLKSVQEIRADFDAISKRITALGNSGPAISLEAITPLVQQVIAEALKNGGELINIPGPHEGGTTLASLAPPKTNGAGNA